MGFVRWIATRLVGFAGRPTPTAVVAAAAPAPAGPSPAEIAMLRALFTPTRQGFRSRWWMAMWWLTAVLAIGVVIALVLWISPPLGPDPSTGDVAVLCVVSLAAGLALFASSMLAMTWRADDFDVLAAASISVATAGVGVVVVGLALPFRRSQTLRSQIDHHVRLLQRGVRPSTDAVTELCSLLRIGLGSAGMFAIPIVQPDKCERALYLYGHTSDRRDLLPLLEEARARLRWFGRTEPVRRLNLSTLRELGDELRDRPPHERPGPVQIATFGIVLELTRRPYDDVLALIEPVWQLACQAGTPAEHDRCLREMGDLSDRLKV